MKVVSLHVPEDSYDAMKELAEHRGEPVAGLIREAMVDYLARERQTGPSVLDLPAFRGGARFKEWSHSDLFDEMIG